MLLAVFAAIAGGNPPPPAASATANPPVTVLNSRPAPYAGRIGTCEADGRTYNLNRLMVLENEAVEIDGPREPLRVSVAEEFVQIHTAGISPGRAVFAMNVGDLIDPNVDLDLELKLGYFDGNLVIFWKETFHHRLYRQGLFRIEGESIAPLCAGRGGVTRRD